MKKHQAKKLISVLMAAVMLFGSGLTVSAANTVSSTTSGSNSDSSETLKDISDTLNLIKYDKYLQKYGYDEKAVPDPVKITVDATDYDKAATNATVKEEKWVDKDCIVVEEEGSVSWNVNIPKAGFYTIDFNYSAYTEAVTEIERVFKLNDVTPFSEGRYISFAKTWYYNYNSTDRNEAFKVDPIGNELIPDRKMVNCWDDQYLVDYYGFYTNPLEVYFKAGNNKITLEGVRDVIALSSIEIATKEVLPTYEDVQNEYKSKGYTNANAEPVFMEAEMPTNVSSTTIYPIFDRSSSITSPQDSSLILRNTMGGNKWTKSGKWIRYEFDCTESGLYDIVTRYKQNYLNGMYTSRSLKINGEFPFEEAKNLRFNFSSEWQTESLTDGNNSFQFYFESGKTYTLEFEVTLGNLSSIARRVNEILISLNDDYMEIVQLTGIAPDENRNYALSRIMPEVITDMGRQANSLYDVVEYISDMNGIKSDNTSTLEQAAILIEKMSSDESEIAVNLSDFKTKISAIGSWVTTVTTQYLELDYLIIQPSGAELPVAVDNAWQAFTYEMKKFVASFTADYTSIGAEDGKESTTISAWTSSGRDQAQIKDNLIKNGYTKDTGVVVNLKLVAAGALIPSILANIGPDVSIDATSPIEMAIRGAILPLNDYDGFDDVMSRFADSAKIPLTLYGKTYAIPEGQSVPVMFCRDDILESLDISVPNTWDELMALVPVLQFNNMEIGMTSDFMPFLYQRGGSYWRDEGIATNLDATESLDAFEYMCNLFTQYSLSYKYDAATRFKNGEMPILIDNYMFYNTMVIFAPEISGLWSFYQLPGTLKDDGTIDRTANSVITGIIMPRGCRDEKASWDFVKYYTAKDFQIGYSNEMMALLGPSAKQGVANLEAFAELPWTKKEYTTLISCLESTMAVVPYPGMYFIDRYSAFAFYSAYSAGADPSDEILSYIGTINKEITRKRTEFKLMVDDEWQAIKTYMGFTTFDEWREYWASERGSNIEDSTCIQDANEAGYTFKDWMQEHGVTADGYEDWSKEVSRGNTTLSYKDWIEESNK